MTASGPARLVAISLGCPDPQLLADFYLGLLGGRQLWAKESSVGYEVTGGVVMVAQRVDDVVPPDWPGTAIVHLDLTADDLATAEKRALALGANATAWLHTWLDRNDDAENAAYMVLTACRMWRFGVSGQHASRTDAARWALDHDPSLTRSRQSCAEHSETSTRTLDPERDALDVRPVLRWRSGEEAAMADPVGDIIGDYRAFAAQQRDRLLARGIDIAPYSLSHLAFRVPEWDQYVQVRTLLERHAVANRENVWNGRPISLIVPAEPLDVLDGQAVPLIELIPPVHQRVYKMGLEHLGVGVGDEFDAFVTDHKPVLTGQQFQGPNSMPDPVYILFEDFTHVKFYRLSLRDSVELDAGPFGDGFHHVDDWVPQRLVTATGPNPLPR